MSETFECPKCGYQWQQGQHGGHSCSDRLLQQLKDVMTERNSILADWNAIVSASGSKTHGGAVGHVAQMRAELEAVKADKEMQQRRGDCHWETLRSIRDIAQTSGDIQRIIQWVNDAGGGYTESNEATMAKLMDQIEELKSERDALRARIEAAEKQEPVGWVLEKSGCRAPDDCEYYLDFHEMGKADAEELAHYLNHGRAFQVYALPPIPAQQYGLPDDWEENIYNAMDEAFKLGKFADGGMQNDDTQIGVEFAVAYFKKMLAQQYSEYPMQPIIDGRFEANPIVDMLVDKVGLNEISVWWQINEIPIKYTEQLAQLIGYSLGGYSELDYVSDESYERAVKMAAIESGNGERL